MSDDIELAGLSEAELAELAEFIDPDVRGVGGGGGGKEEEGMRGKGGGGREGERELGVCMY